MSASLRRTSPASCEPESPIRKEEPPMNAHRKPIVLASLATLLVLGATVYGQVHKYYTPGSVWGVTMIRIHSGMDQAYLEYLDTQLKKESEISIKNGFMKSYKILRSQGDDGEWN